MQSATAETTNLAVDAPRNPAPRNEAAESGPVNITRIMLIGTGGVGAFIARNLGLLIGVEAILLVDGDEYERKNTNRQAMAFSHIGYKKVDAIKETMHTIAQVQTFDEFINEENLPGLIQDFRPTLIISAVDNDEARVAIWKHRKDLPILWGANELWSPQAGISLPQKHWSPMEAFKPAEGAEACGIQTVHANAAAAAMAMTLLMFHSTDHESWEKQPMFLSKGKGEPIFTMFAHDI